VKWLGWLATAYSNHKGTFKHPESRRPDHASWRKIHYGTRAILATNIHLTKIMSFIDQAKQNLLPYQSNIRDQ
jgi:hypothetical protein